MTTRGHHVVRGNEWKVLSPEMMTYMSYEIYIYPYIHSYTMCIQCMNTNTPTVTHPHTYTHTCMHNIYNCTHDTPPVGALQRRHMPQCPDGRGTRQSLKRRVHWIGLKSLADLQVKNRHDHVQYTYSTAPYLKSRPTYSRV